MRVARLHEARRLSSYDSPLAVFDRLRGTARVFHRERKEVRARAPRLAEVYLDARERGYRVLADYLEVVHADYGDVFGRPESEEVADVRHLARSVVVRGEYAAWHRNRLQPFRETAVEAKPVLRGPGLGERLRRLSRFRRQLFEGETPPLAPCRRLIPSDESVRGAVYPRQLREGELCEGLGIVDDAVFVRRERLRVGVDVDGRELSEHLGRKRLREGGAREYASRGLPRADVVGERAVGVLVLDLDDVPSVPARTLVHSLQRGDMCANVEVGDEGDGFH